jgi:hypothetical protein
MVNTSQIYILILIVILLIIAIVLIFLKRNGKFKRAKRITPLAGLAFVFVIAGIIFGEDRLVGYGLIGVGVLLAIIDIFNRLRLVKKR